MIAQAESSRSQVTQGYSEKFEEEYFVYPSRIEFPKSKVVYSNSELLMINQGNPSKERLIMIHEIKKHFGGKIIEMKKTKKRRGNGKRR